MITYILNEEKGVLKVHPEDSLQKEDFEQLARTVDPFIEKTGGLRGLIIDAPSFPGWKNFAGLVGHIRFVRNHHEHIRRVALVTDSRLGDAAERIGAHFVSAEIRHFPPDQLETAEQWVLLSD